MSHLALKQAGLSLVELMIALTLGLLVTAAVAFVVTSQSQTREHNQGISEAQETARLALEILSSDIAQAGYFGDFGNLRLRHEAVRYRATPTAMTPPAAPCKLIYPSECCGLAVPLFHRSLVLLRCLILICCR